MQGLQESGELLGAVGTRRLQAGRVLSWLVEQDERLAALESGIEIGRTRRCCAGRVLSDRLVKRLAADLQGDLAPQGVGNEFRPLRPVSGQLVPGNSGEAAFARRRQRRPVDQRGRDRGEFLSPQCKMSQRDQSVRLAAAEGRLEAIDGRGRIVSGGAQ